MSLRMIVPVRSCVLARVSRLLICVVRSLTIIVVAALLLWVLVIILVLWRVTCICPTLVGRLLIQTRLRGPTSWLGTIIETIRRTILVIERWWVIAQLFLLLLLLVFNWINHAHIPLPIHILHHKCNGWHHIHIEALWLTFGPFLEINFHLHSHLEWEINLKILF